MKNTDQPQQTEHNTCVLIADDDDQYRDMLIQYLTHNGFSTKSAKNGLEVIQAIAISKVDVIITDIIMPHKEGLETIRAIRKTNPELPIIAISGGSHNLMPEYCLKMATVNGANETLQKPFSLKELLRCIETLQS